MTTRSLANAIHLRIGDKPCGPLTQEQVKALIGQGTVTRHDMVSVDGGESWVPVGKTSLHKYIPKRSRLKAYATSSVSGLVLDFFAVKPLPPESSIGLPKEEIEFEEIQEEEIQEHELKKFKKPLLPSPLPDKDKVQDQVVQDQDQVQDQVQGKAHGRAWVMGFGLAACVLVVLIWMHLRPLTGSVAKEEMVPGMVLVPLTALGRGHLQEVVSFVGSVGAVEGRADPAQLPGLTGRYALVRLHDKAASVLCALPIRGPGGAALPNSVYAKVDDAGRVKLSDAAVLCDERGQRLDPDTRVQVTGTVRFEIRDVRQEQPVIEVTAVSAQEAIKPTPTP